MTVPQAEIEWAKRAMAEGRSMAFIASVLELSERKARNAVFGIDKIERQHFRARVEATEEAVGSDDRPRGKPGPKTAPKATAALPDRRRALLRRRFARHWSMIWFLRAQGMCGRTLRQIYGAEALIWSVGGGIDPDITQ